MKKKLREIADIRIGYQHRERGGYAGAKPDGTHRIIQTKDISENGELDASSLFSLSPKGDPERYAVRQGDVLFLSRGQRALGVPVLEDIRDTLAAYYFFIVRIREDGTVPAYLAWFINQPSAQTFLVSCQRGSWMKMIPKSSFEELEVPLPPLTTQQTIVKLERLRRDEERDCRRLVDARRQLINGLALKAAMDTPPRNRRQT